MKPKTISLSPNKDNCIVRMHNRKMIMQKSDDGYKILFRIVRENKDDPPTCIYHRIRNVDETIIALSFEAIEAMYLAHVSMMEI